MKQRHLWSVTLAAVGLARLSLHAQTPAVPDVRKPFRFEDDKPIPRALPVVVLGVAIGK